MTKSLLPLSIAALVIALAAPAQAGRPGQDKPANEQLLGAPGEPGSGVGRIVEGGGDTNRLQAPLPRRPRNDDAARARDRSLACAWPRPLSIIRPPPGCRVLSRANSPGSSYQRAMQAGRNRAPRNAAVLSAK